VLIIDEADRMFDMGFIRDLRRILRRCPPYDARQTMMFSATLSPRVMELAYEHTNNAEKVEVEPERVGAHGITEVLYHCSTRQKLALLLGLLEKEGGSRILIFVNRRTTAAELVRALSANGFPTRALAGNVPQEKRLKILRDSTSRAFRTSSTTTSRRTPRTTSTASGGPDAPARWGPLSRSPARTTSSRSTRSRS
jgi:ATP-dependent RNA helicase RhlB